MKTGFTFKGRHSDEFGLVMKTSSRPILPEMKSYTYESPLMDGVYDFSAANSYGREFYRNRSFTLIMQVYAENLAELQHKISHISVWLTGRGELIFDDTPLVKWCASVLNGIDYAPEKYGRKAVLSVSFDVQPFSECIFDTADGPALDMPIMLDTAIPIDTEAALTFGTNTINVTNCGTWYVRPTLIFDVSESSGCFTNLSVECGGKQLSIGMVSSSYNLKKIVIDLEKHTVKDGNGINLMKYVSGEFFELAPGKNTIKSAGNIAPFKTQVIYTPEFMYDFDADWGDESA